MCGICGTVGRANAHELTAMTDVMSHRGPDGADIRVFDEGGIPAGLGHRRLAIIDPTPAGAQPMSFDNRWWITYNGELYNFRELRAELEAEGERFCTSSDTEVLLRMFAVHGEAMLPRLNGIYAFAIWDSRDRRLFIARDRLGVKPLYYARGRDWFAFASEIKPLLPLLPSVELEPTALADFLTFLWVPDPQTAFRGVMKLPAGHCAWVDGGKVDIRQWWDLRFEPAERTEQEWCDAVAAAVDAAVQRQMVSDVPLGSFLSGGVDSSAIVASMAATGSRVSTYSIGFSERDLAHEIVPDDLRYAREGSLMPMLLALGDAARVHEILRSVAHACPGEARLGALRDLAHTHRRSLEGTAALVQSGVTVLPGDGPGALEAIRAQFDRAVALAPEAAVALYSLGSRDVLERASTEITERLDAWGLLRADADLLDLGCGIGRIVRALAGRVRSIAGVDVSPGMIEEARRRCAGIPGVRLEVGNGRDLAMMTDTSVDLALAIDSCPYIVAAGAHLVRAHFHEVRRVLRPGGAWLMLNYSYRGDPRHDVDEVTANAHLVGFDVERAGARDLALWDGVTFLLRKPAD